MSFNGDLQHLSIVDIIQLLYSIRKSGILRVAGPKGESQLVFKDGCIVSASHLNNSLRIGEILVRLGKLSFEALDRVLLEQRSAGTERRPLIVMLLEKELVSEKDAYNALEQLIELTIVEIFSWKKGTFYLDVAQTITEDEYKYYPDRMSKEIIIDTQSVLMESLRIFDEKVRDGELPGDDAVEDEPAPPPAQEEADSGLSADDLGLTELDSLEQKTPRQFSGIVDLSPEVRHRLKLQEIAPWLAPAEQETLVDFLRNYAPLPPVAATAERSIVFFSPDELMIHLITTVCSWEDILIFATNEERDLDQILAQFIALNRVPILVLDVPGDLDGEYSAARLGALRREKLAGYARLCVIQFALPADLDFSLEAYRDGVRAVMPRPSAQAGAFAGAAIKFLQTFPGYIKGRPC